MAIRVVDIGADAELLYLRAAAEALMKSFAAILAAALGLAAVGVLAIMYGSSDDAPDLSLIGLLLIVGAFAIGVRAVYRRWRGAGRRQRAHRR